jgi:hypothetical protein
MKSRPSFFCDVMQRTLVAVYRRFGTTYRILSSTVKQSKNNAGQRAFFTACLIKIFCDCHYTKINFEKGFSQVTTLNAAFQIHNYDLKNTKDCAKSGITISVTISFSGFLTVHHNVDLNLSPT